MQSTIFQRYSLCCSAVWATALTGVLHRITRRLSSVTEAHTHHPSVLMSDHLHHSPVTRLVFQQLFHVAVNFFLAKAVVACVTFEFPTGVREYKAHSFILQESERRVVSEDSAFTPELDGKCKGSVGSKYVCSEHMGRC